MQLKEVLLAIDPAMRRIEEILLWKNKFKTGAVFTTCHFFFWLLQTFNIRTYCTISFVFLCLHMLDAYRAKKRRHLIKMHQASPNLIENLSSLSRYVLNVHAKFNYILSQLNKLKQKNRIQHFLIMFTFWSVCAVVGAKVRGFFLSYLIFWFLFFVPAILHYNIPRKLLNKAIPFLEQLDHSMKYERRSVLDKSELLVDVKLPNTSDIDADLEEDEYLRSFKLDNLEDMKEKQRRAFENLEDDDDEEEEDEEEYENDEDDNDEEDDVENSQEINLHGRNIKNVNIKENHHQLSIKLNKNNRDEDLTSAKFKSKFFQNDDLDTDDSLLPNESFPTINYGDNSSLLNGDLEDEDESRNNSNLRNVFNKSGRIRSNLVKVPVVKSRPSVLDYYKENNATTTTTTTILKPRTGNSHFQSSFTTTAPQSHLIYRNDNKEDENDDEDENKPLSPSKIPIGLKFNQNSIANNDGIDETFDFLDEEY